MALLDRYDGREDGMEALEGYLNDLVDEIRFAQIDFDSTPQHVALAAIENVFVQIENHEDSPQHPRYLTPAPPHVCVCFRVYLGVGGGVGRQHQLTNTRAPG